MQLQALLILMRPGVSFVSNKTGWDDSGFTHECGSWRGGRRCILVQWLQLPERRLARADKTRSLTFNPWRNLQ